MIMTSRAFFRACVVSLVLLVPGFAMAQTWPNEPDGSTQLLDCNFSSTPAACGIQDVYSSAIQDTDGTATVSPSGVIRSTIYAGNTSGGMQLNYVAPSVYNEWYVGIVFRTNAGFEGRTTANKTFFVRGPGTNGFFGLGGPPGSTSWPVYFGHNTASFDNSHTCAFDLGLVCNPNAGSSNVARGSWAKVEAYFKKSTTSTSRDGIVRWWVNGVLVGNYTTMNYSPSGINEWVWSETWDGTVTNPIPSVDWSYFIDHLHISIPNCSGNCSGAPVDLTPPSQVTGVTVTSTTATGATLSWTPATDNVSVVGYHTERCLGASCTDFSNLSSTSTPSITFSALSPGTTYRVRIKAYDAAGNVSSSYSSVVSFTTSGIALPAMTLVDADSTGANVAWTGSPASIRVQTDSLNIVEPMSAFPVSSETIAHVQSRSVAGSGSSISLAYNSNNTAGNFLALRLTAFPSSVSISNCSDTRGNTWEPVPNATGGSGGYQAIRFAKNVLAGANTVTCTLTGSATSSTLDIFEKSGVDRTAPLDQSKLTQQVDPGTGTDAISSGSVTTTADGELILGATLQVGSTVYDAAAQFSGTQGPIWYYKDSSGTNLTWMGSYWAGSGYLGIWDSGGHPGSSLDSVRRWVAPSDGEVRITGTARNVGGCGGFGTLVSIKKNGTTLWSQHVPATGSYPYDVTTSVVATDQLDFVINKYDSSDSCDSTAFAPTITLGTSSGSGGTTTLAGTGFTLRHATVSDSPSADQVQSTAGPIAATFTGADALNDYITSIATFKPAASSIRYSRVWPSGTTFACMYPRDALGNENAVSPGYECDSVTPGADTVPPVRSNGQPSGTLAAGTPSATISLVTNEFSTCRYSTSAGVAYGSMVNMLDASANALFHSQTIGGLSNGNTYTYYVRCQDVFLNANTTDTTISFSVASSAGDTEVPSKVTGLQGLPLNASQISLTWTAATDNVGVTGYEVYVAESGADYTLGATSSTTSAILSGLSPATLHLVKVRARDAVGNFGDDSDAIVILTPPSDVTPPSDLTGLLASAVDFQSLALSWTAGTDDVGIVSTNIEQCQGTSCTDFLLVGTVTSGTTLSVSGLMPQTTYRFRAKHADAAGNVSLNYSPVVTGTTLAVPVGTVTAVCRCKHHR